MARNPRQRRHDAPAGCVQLPTTAASFHDPRLAILPARRYGVQGPAAQDVPAAPQGTRRPVRPCAVPIETEWRPHTIMRRSPR